MRRAALFFFALLFFVVFARVYAQDGDDAQASPVVLTEQQNKYPIGRHLEILEDPAGELTIDDVTSPAYDSLFLRSQDAIPNFGFTDSAYWVRLRLRNASSTTENWLLVLNFEHMHFVDFYSPSADGVGFEVRQTGVMRHPLTREIPYPRLSFTVTPPNQNMETYYLRFENGAPMVLSLSMWQPAAFFAQSLWLRVPEILFYGIMLGLLVYSIFLATSLREMIYLYLAALLASAIVFELGQTSLLDVYVIPRLYQFRTPFIGLSAAAIMASLILFFGSFLGQKTIMPAFYRINLLLMGFALLLGLASFVLTYYQIARVFTVTVIFILGFNMIGVALAWRRGFQAARFLLIAMLGFLACILVFMLARMNIIPISVFTENAFRIGFIWMAIGSSLALTDRINLLTVETKQANRDLVHSEQRLTQTLEAMPVGVVVYGPDQKPMYINKRTADILNNPERGIGPHPDLERTLPQAMAYYAFRISGTDEAYPPETFPVKRALLGEAAHADDIEADLIDWRVPLEVWASPVLDGAGNVESAVVAFQDVSERKKKDAELEQYRKHLEQMVERQTAELSATNEWLSTLKRVRQTIDGTADLPQVCDRLLASTLKLFNARLAFLLRWDNQGEHFEIECLRGREDDSIKTPEKLAFIVGNTPPLRQELLAGEPVRLSDSEAESMPGEISDLFQRYTLQTILLKPVTGGQSVEAVFGIVMQQPAQDITEVQVELIKTIALDLFNLIEGAELLDQAQASVIAAERNSLARELHDSVTQILFSASVLAESTPRIWEKNQEVARMNMEKLGLLLRGALAEMRTLLFELRFDQQQGQSLEELLTALIDSMRTRTQVIISLNVNDKSELPENVTQVFYRIAREALNNVIVHAEATGVSVFTLSKAHCAELHIRDDGVGFNPQTMEAGHMGISIMSERAASIGADLQIQSAPGWGTDVVVTWPVNGAESIEND